MALAKLMGTGSREYWRDTVATDLNGGSSIVVLTAFSTRLRIAGRLSLYSVVGTPVIAITYRNVGGLLEITLSNTAVAGNYAAFNLDLRSDGFADPPVPPVIAVLTLQAIPTELVVERYVDGIYGDDAANGETWDTAWRTYDRTVRGISALLAPQPTDLTIAVIKRNGVTGNFDIFNVQGSTRVEVWEGAVGTLPGGQDTAAAPLRILPIGDSRMIGNTVGGWRRVLSELMRVGGWDFEFLGAVLGGDTQRFTLHDWRHEAHAADTWAIMTAAIAARVAVTGQPDVILVDLGTVECLAHTAIATIEASALAGIATLRALCPGARIIVGTLNALPADAAGEALRLLYNTWLLGLNGTVGNVAFVDTASDLQACDLANNVDANERGSATIGRRWFNEITKMFPNRRGLPFPRTVSRRAANGQSLVNATDNTDNFAVANTAFRLTAGSNYLLSFWFCPTVLGGTGQAMVACGDYAVTGFQLGVGFTGTTDLLVHLAGQGHVLAVPSSPLVINNWFRVSVGFFHRMSETDTRPCVAVWINGRLMGVAFVTAWVNTAAGSLLVGLDSVNGEHGCPAYFDNLVVAKWAGAPYYDGARELVERDYYEGSASLTQGAYYTLDNVLTDLLGGAAGALNGGAAFGASGFAKPSDP